MRFDRILVPVNHILTILNDISIQLGLNSIESSLKSIKWVDIVGLT